MCYGDADGGQTSSPLRLGNGYKMPARWMRVGTVIGIGVGALAGCAPKADPKDCPPPHATFVLSVDCADGPVPRDTKVSVVFGSGVEEFRADAPNTAGKSVFCSIVENDAGAPLEEDGGDNEAVIEGITCQMWTDGPATVTATASGYPDVVRPLAAARDECGLVLTEARMTLEKGD